MTLQIKRIVTIFISILAFSVTAAEDWLWPLHEWALSTPESQQVDVAALDILDREFVSGEHGYIDGMMIFRNGNLVYEKTYDHDYDQLFVGRDQTRWQYRGGPICSDS